ncbi:MAG: hypothetical protein GY832_45300 [Chloroflexi bacterium]|nr:hypothetical protein [Chloroflexota bacterium]
MRNIHLNEFDLAWLGELDNNDLGNEIPDAEMVEHLRWCADCRSAIADHQWLQETITTTLAIAVDAVSVPRPKWWAVQEALLFGRQRQVASWRGSTIASVVLAVCLMLSASPLLGTAAMVAQMVQASPEAVIATVPDMKTDTVLSPSVATPTPAIQVQSDTPALTPVLVLPPTPDQSGI